MKKKACLFIVLLVFQISFGQAQKDNLNDVIVAANKGLASYLEKIPVGQETLYGFKNRDEFPSADIGKPYQVNTLSAEFFGDIELRSDKNYLEGVGEYKFPVVVNGEYKIMLIVSRMKEGWKVVAIGATGLAKELQDFERNYSSNNQSITLLTVHQLQGDFVIVNSGVANNWIAYPLSTGNMSLGNFGKSDSHYTLNQLLTLIKTIVSNNKK